MKILVITNDFPPKVGGINYYVDQIARRLPPGEVTVFASTWPGAPHFDASYPQRVVRWPSRTMLPTPSVRARAATLAREEDADVVLFGASMPLALMGPGITRRTGVPYAACTHGLEIGAARVPVGRTLLRRIGGGAALLTGVSRWQIGLIREVVGPRTRIELLPAGIDAGAFHPGVSGDTVRSRHGLGNRPVIVCVSRLVARKGQDQVIRALPAVEERIPGVRFLVVGSGPDEGRLRRLAARAGVRDRVVFAGQVGYGELPQFFRAGDVFAMPCRSRFLGLEDEALGAVFYQAAAVGRPSVGGDTGGVSDAIRHGETGLLVDGRDTASVARALATVLEDRASAARMGEAGATWVHRELTWDAVAARLRVLLEDVVAERPARTSGSRRRTA